MFPPKYSNYSWFNIIKRKTYGRRLQGWKAKEGQIFWRNRKIWLCRMIIYMWNVSLRENKKARSLRMKPRIFQWGLVSMESKSWDLWEIVFLALRLFGTFSFSSFWCLSPIHLLLRPCIYSGKSRIYLLEKRYILNLHH